MHSKFAFAIGVGAALTSQALAIPIPLPPGASVPVLPGAVIGGVLKATTTDGFSNVLYGGNVQSWVYDDPAWALGLTFVYQVQLAPNAGGSLDNIHRFSSFNWESFFTAVEQDSSAGDAAASADRDPFPGGTVAFNFPAGFVEGESSALLVIRSDANSWKTGIGGVINGQTSNVDILAPARAVIPDGGTSLILFGLGLFGLGSFRRLYSV